MNFKISLEKSPIGYTVIDKNKNFLYANPSFCTFVGHSLKTLNSKTFSDITYPADIEKGSKEFERLIRGEIHEYRLQKRYIHKSGEIIWGDLFVSLIHDDREPSGFTILTSIIDITERERSSKALKDHEAFMSHAEEIARMGSWEWDIGKNVTRWSENLYRLFKVSPKNTKVSFEYFLSKVHPDDRYMITEGYDQLVQQKRKMVLEHRILLPDNEIMWIQNSIKPFFENGKMVGLRGVNLDITKRKRTEAELIKSKEKAEESDRLKTAFLQNISHEIRTPMNGILGFMQFLQEPSISSNERNEYIDIVNQSGARLMNTVNDIIKISKIESGINEINITDVNTEDVLLYNFNFFKALAEKKGLALMLSEKFLCGTTAIIQTDNTKLEGILSNLINNAIKYTKEGTIEIGNYREGTKLVFFVKDSGIGIPKDRIKSIFDRFIQVDDQLARTYEGVGLGLSIAKAHIDILGGKIWVDSIIGKGSTFFFSIPYVPVKLEHTPKEAPLQGIPKNTTVLLAEDDRISFLYCSKLLQKQGITVIHAQNGASAVDKFKENKSVSLILMDLNMPFMDGLAATRQIRSFDGNIPIIAQTGLGFREDKAKAFEAGCSDYISKPIDSAKLIGLIKKHIHEL
ncbi:PAS domain S-box-containing protein [Arenibacter nanhaiticus]|uniref:histidine kinase n=1 Tax=Arenibacter nanhaiticus TaxID=558155 RepID=A0A1M6KP48_9FLAO|nr:PAS domain S-box protein [Arenibacter nanhaiticus]SHJ60661.1 PAS domain S-box-containing protein [Arenibacter nanhaiticus]